MAKTILDLPAELRNRIYRLAVKEDRQMRLDIQKKKQIRTDFVKQANSTLAKFVIPGIAQLCQQTRSESLLLFYFLNTFVLIIDCKGYVQDRYVLHDIFSKILATPKYGKTALRVMGVLELRENAVFENSVFVRIFATPYDDMPICLSRFPEIRVWNEDMEWDRPNVDDDQHMYCEHICKINDFVLLDNCADDQDILGNTDYC